MQDRSDDIVVLRKFDSAIDANLAKTKLDAYDIPCFLTNENMANLYPGLPLIAPIRIGLHIFSHDREKAEQILTEQSPLQVAPDDEIRCPRCGSTNFERDYSHKEKWKWFFTIAFFIFPASVVSRCKDCNTEF